jgi:uncharacterized protein YceK
LYRSILLVVAAFLFLIISGCSSETNVPTATNEKTSAMPGGTTGLKDDKAAMTEKRLPMNQVKERQAK